MVEIIKRECLSKEQKEVSVPEELQQEILARLRQIGHNGLGLSPKKWAQLAALREAALLMNERCRDARLIQKANALTPTNAERVLKELGGVTFTDQTMYNNDGLLKQFLLTFEQAEMSGADARKEVKKLKEQVALWQQKVEKMESRDADWLDAQKRMADLEKQNEELKQDKRDLIEQLNKRTVKQKAVSMVQLDLTNNAKNKS